MIGIALAALAALVVAGSSAVSSHRPILTGQLPVMEVASLLHKAYEDTAVSIPIKLASIYTSLIRERPNFNKERRGRLQRTLVFCLISIILTGIELAYGFAARIHELA